MKPEWNKKYATISVYVFLTAAAIILFLSAIIYREGLLAWINSLLAILRPVIYGIAIGYLLAPLDRSLRKLISKPFKNSKKDCSKLCSVLSIIASYIVFIIFAAGFLFLVVPEIGKSLEEISSRLPDYYKTVVTFVTNLDIPFLDIPKNEEELKKYLGHAYDIVKGVFPQLYSFLEGLVTEVMNFIIGILISIYVLSGRGRFKRRCRKLLNAVFEEEKVVAISRFWYQVDRVFGGFITGKILDSAIIGVICFILMTILRLPYAMLISVMVGVTNVIPIFGPFIGAIPSALIILLVSPTKTIWFIIMIIALQQLDGNVIGPKILGETTGLPSFWVIFSLILFGGFFGVFGMLIAVPVFALIYNGIKAFAERRLKKKGLPVNTDEY